MLQSYPPELLYNIAGLVVARYIDEVVAGANQLLQTQKHIREGRLFIVSFHSGKLPKPEDVLSLLGVSYQFRSVTLKALSQALSIAVVDEGIGRLELDPWDVVIAARKKWQHPDEDSTPVPQPLSPLIQCYITLANLQVKHSPYTQNPDHEEYRLALSRFEALDELRAVISQVPDGTLGHYVITRLLGAYAFVLSCRSYRQLEFTQRALETLSSVSKLPNHEAATQCANTVERILDDLKTMICVRTSLKAFLAHLQGYAGQGLQLQPCEAGRLDFAVLKKVVEQIVDYPDMPDVDFQECRRTARDILDEWSTHFPLGVCPHSEHLVPKVHFEITNDQAPAPAPEPVPEEGPALDAAEPAPDPAPEPAPEPADAPETAVIPLPATVPEFELPLVPLPEAAT